MEYDNVSNSLVTYELTSHALENMRNDLPELKTLLNNKVEEAKALLRRIQPAQSNINKKMLRDILVSFNKFAAEVQNITERAFTRDYSDETELITVANDMLLRFDKFKYEWYKTVQPILIDSEIIQLQKSINSDEIHRNLELSREEIRKTNDLYDGLLKKVEGFDERYSNQIAKLESLYQQDNFKHEAVKAKNLSYVWLAGVVIFCGILFLVAYQFLTGNLNDTIHLSELTKLKTDCEDCFQTVVYLEIFKTVLFRILIVSILIFALGFCTKNYNAYMHNHTINLHKSNSLYASGVLLNRAKTETGIDSLINSAANAIFSQQPTGYNYKGQAKVDLLTDQITRAIKSKE